MKGMRQVLLHMYARRFWIVTALLLLVAVVQAFAQTPMDTGVTSVIAAIPLWARLFVMVIGLGIAILIMAALQLGAAVIVYIVLALVGVVFIGAAASGNLAIWAGIP